MDARKRCSGCGAEKLLTDFYRSSRYRDGRQIWCKSCSLQAVKKHQEREGKSVVHRAVKYGLTRDEVRAMLAIPVCQSCGSELGDSYTLKFDHCHERGHFRGVLCHPCNMACMGRSEDAMVRLSRCIEYLRRDVEREQV